MARYPFVLLDADNTLFDFDAAEHTALAQVTASLGRSLTADIEALYLSINRALWTAFDLGQVTQEFLVVERFRRFTAALGLQADPAALNRDYLTCLGQCGILLPGAEELCRDLARHCTLALCTNGVARVQHARLAESPLAPYLSGVFISEELGFQKPQPEFFFHVFQALGIAQPDRQAVMVGDNPGSDILGGIQAGIHTIWYDPKGLPAPQHIVPTYTVKNYDEIRQIILT